MVKIALVKEKENSSIISGFILDLLQIGVHCNVSHQCPVGLAYWVTLGAAFYIRSIFINLIALCISKKDVLHLLLIMVVPERVK